MLLVLVTVLAWWAVRPTPTLRIDHPTEVILLEQADMGAEGQDTLLPVPLPDTWAARGLPSSGRARYRVRFDLGQVPVELWALRAPALSTHHDVRLNGHLVSGELATDPTLRRSLPAAQLITLPPALFEDGRNVLDIRVSHGSIGGLSVIEVGPLRLLEVQHGRDNFRRQVLPITLNTAALLLSVAMLVLRWRHPRERLTGMIGALALVGTLRNLLDFVTQDLPKEALGDGLYLGLQLLGVWFIGVGANTVALGALRRPTRWLGGVVVLGWLAAVAAMSIGQFRPVRGLVLALAFVGATTLLVWAGRHIAWSMQRTRPWVYAGLVLTLASGVHDFLLRFGLLEMDLPDWLPLGVPVGLTLVAWALLGRTARALNRVQDANAALEQRVAERTRALEQANAAKSRFLAAASHDLRQPVVTVGLLVGLLREQIADARQRLMIDRVDAAVSSMEELLEGLLDLSRLEAGTITPRRDSVSVQHLFDAIATHEAETARQKGLRLRFRPTPQAAVSDPVLLQQILRNLVNNAVRYTDHGGVLVACRRRGRRLLIQVWDTGRGIPADRHSQVFEEFVRIDAAGGDRTRGLGLGLSIVSRSAQLLGHTLRLRSVPERGSCFELELQAATAAQPITKPVTPEARPLAGVRVAVIEDEDGVREALRDRLSYWGAEVASFASRAALERHALGQDGRWTELIISDQRLGDGAGIEVIDWLRRRQGATPAVLVTGDTDPLDLSHQQRAPIPVLHKPFRADKLLAAIRDAQLAPAPH